MELDPALESMSWAHRTALRLHLAGVGPAAIGAELGMDADAARDLLKIAHEKLRVLLADDS